MLGCERHALLYEWNDTAGAVPPGTLHGPFKRQAALTPKRLALAAPGYRLSYAELAARVERLAGVLREAGARAGSTIAICIERSPQLVAALLATLEAGAACVPLDPSYPAERLSFMVADSGATLLITEARFAALVAEAGVRRVLLDGAEALVVGLPAPGAAPAPAAAGGPDDLAYLLYTSGSTGPQGVMMTHRAVANRLHWMQRAFPLAASDRLLHTTQVSSDASIWEIFLPLWCGALLVLAKPGGDRDSEYLARTVMEQEITVLQLVPSMLKLFLEEPEIVRCGALRRVFCSGESLPEALRQRFFARLRGTELYNLYGPTETAIDASCFSCRRHDPAGLLPIGRPIDNVSLHVLDSRLELAPLGMPGELAIGGAGLAVGYQGLPCRTAEKFIPDPWAVSPGSRLYRSGDLVRRRTDGVLELLGRIDQQVKLRGFRIELGEIEAALESMAGVREAVVVVREDTPGDRRLVAYLTAAREAAPPRVADLRARLRRSLPEPMVPAVLVVLAELPRLATGRLKRRELPVPESVTASTPRPYTAPRDAIERALAEIWAQVLHTERVGIDDNFFELGGNGNLFMEVVSRAGARGWCLPSSLISERQTIRTLAHKVLPAPRQ